VDVAVARGASILPYRFRDDSAARFAQEHEAVLAGGRGSGSAFSLSPASLESVHPGAKIVLPSPNGAALTLAAAKQDRAVLAGCLRNTSAVARHASTLGRSILIVPAGERWEEDHTLRPAVEDLVGAGAVIAGLAEGSRSPEAEAACAAFVHAKRDLAGFLLNCASGRELAERGYGGDVQIAARHDISNAVPRFDGVAYQNAAH
jgi:2-phosphosulfolactate phosphatase